MTKEELTKLKQDNVREEIFNHRNDDPVKYAFSNHSQDDFPVRTIAEQIACYQKAKQKLPDLYRNQLLYHPVSLQQSTASALAKLKPEILRIHGQKLIDMTGGLGIDTIFFSKYFDQIEYCERDPILADVAGFNFQKLGLNNIRINQGDSISYLQAQPDQTFDWLYVDPSRRDENRRFIAMEDSFPNVVEYLELFLQKSHNICIKLSPAIEITEILRKLKRLKSISAFSLDGECKEVTCVIDTKIPADNEPIIQAVVIKSGEQSPVILQQESGILLNRIFSGIKGYLYEPDPAIIKSRLTSLLTAENDLFFINHQTDYLTSEAYIHDFPGRAFKVVNYFPFKSGRVNEYLSNENILSANVARRDFPMSPAQIKKKFHLRDGGGHYLFFSKDMDENKIFIHCIKP